MSMFFLWRDPKALRVSTVRRNLPAQPFGQYASPPVMFEDLATVQALIRHANVSVSMNTYVQAVTTVAKTLV